MTGRTHWFADKRDLEEYIDKCRRAIKFAETMPDWYKEKYYPHQTFDQAKEMEINFNRREIELCQEIKKQEGW